MRWPSHAQSGQANPLSPRLFSQAIGFRVLCRSEVYDRVSRNAGEGLGKHMKRIFGFVTMSLLLTACTSSHVLVGKQRPPISPSEVQLYLDPPAQYEKVAVLESNNSASFAFTSQQKMNKVIERLKIEAAALGANGVLFQGAQNQYTGSVGSANAWASGNSAYGLGVSSAMYMKVGAGIAIYVPSGSEVVQSSQPAAAVILSPVRPAETNSVPYEADPAKRCSACTRLTTP
jgi:hypothetical protein